MAVGKYFLRDKAISYIYLVSIVISKAHKSAMKSGVVVT